MTHRTCGSEFANVPLLFPLMTSDEIIIAGAVLELRPYRAGRNENCGTPDASSQLTCLERRPTRYEQSVFPWPNRAVGWLSRVPSNPPPCTSHTLGSPPNWTSVSEKQLCSRPSCTGPRRCERPAAFPRARDVHTTKCTSCARPNRGAHFYPSCGSVGAYSVGEVMVTVYHQG